MPSRRTFLAGAVSAHLAPSLSWADAGSPAYLSAARAHDDTFHLFGLDADARSLFSIPLPGRGHAAACHPVRPEAVAFARRPGTFALILDCVSGETRAHLTAPDERHFYGHGVFSRDGARLYTTENAFELGEGRVGIWDATDGYRRIGEVWSGGIGPHDIVRLPGSDTLVIANGGIDTHPESGRVKLNLPTMQPNLTYLDAGGAVLERAEADPNLRLNSIRHLAVRSDGLVAFACQWQSDPFAKLVLQGTHRTGETLRWLEGPASQSLPSYAGSIAFSTDGRSLGVTYPRSGGYETWDLASGDLGVHHQLDDACGIAPRQTGFLVTSGTGRIQSIMMAKARSADQAMPVSWDNHLVAVG
ncbi:MAG: DUF1513 domain-containing protein [Pseudomonadota bacterium]